MNIGILLMVKNEENSIRITLQSTNKFFKFIVLLDTGSADNTIKYAKEICDENKQKLYVKETKFKSFPESRNEAIEFAESIKEDIDFFILMDAGDEFKTNLSVKEFYKSFKTFPKYINFGVVTQKWLRNNKLEEHCDIRFIRNHKNCRYDTRYPVHEAFINAQQHIVFNDLFYLYQDRDKFGMSSEERYYKDIEILSKAEQNKRNLYFLAQSYMSVNDFKNGFIYNLKSYETKEKDLGSFDEKFTLVRIGFCALQCKMNKDIIFKYLLKAIECEDPPVDAYIYILQYCIENQSPYDALQYIYPLSKLNKPSNLTLCNHYFYDYLRWHLISIICLMTNQELSFGKYCCEKAIRNSNNPNDIRNLNLFK